jgi:hypothetical protein
VATDLASMRETGSLPRNFSVIGKNSAETERYQRIYSDNNSESTLSDIRRVQFNWFVDKQL